MTATKRTVGKGLIVGYDKPEDLEPLTNEIDEFFKECAAGNGTPVVRPSTRGGAASLEMSCVAEPSLVEEKKGEGPLRAPEKKSDL